MLLYGGKCACGYWAKKIGSNTGLLLIIYLYQFWTIFVQIAKCFCPIVGPIRDGCSLIVACLGLARSLFLFDNYICPNYILYLSKLYNICPNYIIFVQIIFYICPNYIIFVQTAKYICPIVGGCSLIVACLGRARSWPDADKGTGMCPPSTSARKEIILVCIYFAFKNKLAYISYLKQID